MSFWQQAERRATADEDEDDSDSPWPAYYDPDRDEVVTPGEEDEDNEPFDEDYNEDNGE